MKAYATCKKVRQIILRHAAEVMNYKNWGHKFAAKRIRELPEFILQHTGKINIAELTAEQMEDLGFERWSEETPMRLIPLWLFPFLPDELNVECIDGTRLRMKVADMENDHRFGCLAYGILPSDHKQEQLPLKVESQDPAVQP